MSLISEMRRRQVFRAAAWYGGLAWFAVEVASTVFPRFGLPEWSVRAVIVAAALGLPVALALAWWFDLSTVGLRRETAGVPAGQAPVGAPGVSQDSIAAPSSSAPLWRIPSFWIALLLGAGLAVSAQQGWQRLIRPNFGARPGIAVLPFANLSPDPANAFFADGLHEEILATLARASGLRVISRTSVQQYRDTQRNLRDIADALDVSLILEGSVRRDGDDLRLTLQLIDGHTDEHLWAETYDRKFENALNLQRTIAQQIVAAIGARLTPTEERLIARASPVVPEAYAYYLQALASWNKDAYEADLRIVEGLLTRTLELDPSFALAYALRAKVRIWTSTAYSVPDKTVLQSGAQADIARALSLQPELPEALAARGMYSTYVKRDAAGALPDLDRALELAPNDADAQDIAGLANRRLGRFDDAIRHFRESARLMPGEFQFAGRTFQTLYLLGRYEEAELELREVERRIPNERPYELVHYWIRFLRSGATDGWREALERLSAISARDDRFTDGRRLFLAEGDLPSWIALVEEYGPEAFNDRTQFDFELGVTLAATSDMARARPHLQVLADVGEALLQSGESSVGLIPEAIALALLGQSDAAIRLADAAVRETPGSRDAVNGPAVAMHRAWVLIHAGGARADEGYAELERLLGHYSLQPREVSIEPLWLILRDDVRVQEIIRAAIAMRDRDSAAAGALTPPATAADPRP